MFTAEPGPLDRFAVPAGRAVAVDVVGRLLDGRERLGLLAALARGLGADDVDRAPVRVREQEGAERAAAGVEALRRAPEADDHLLHDLLRHRAVAHDAERQREDRARVPAVDLLEGLLPTLGDEDGQRRVARVCQASDGHGRSTVPDVRRRPAGRMSRNG